MPRGPILLRLFERFFRDTDALCKRLQVLGNDETDPKEAWIDRDRYDDGGIFATRSRPA